MVILPLGYTVSEVFNAGGNPYGTSFTSGKTVAGPDDEALAVARYQGQRLARYAAVIAAARAAGPHSWFPSSMRPASAGFIVGSQPSLTADSRVVWVLDRRRSFLLVWDAGLLQGLVTISQDVKHAAAATQAIANEAQTVMAANRHVVVDWITRATVGTIGDLDRRKNGVIAFGVGLALQTAANLIALT